MTIKNQLEEVVSLKLEEAMDLDAENTKSTVDDSVKLLDRLIEIEKMEKDGEAKKEEQIRQDHKDRWANGIAIAGIAVPATISVIGIFKTFKFDEAGGIISSTLGRGFINKFIPKK